MKRKLSQKQKSLNTALEILKNYKGISVDVLMSDGLILTDVIIYKLLNIKEEIKIEDVTKTFAEFQKWLDEISENILLINSIINEEC